MTKKKRTNKNRHVGSSFDAFLAEEGMLETCEQRAVKEVLADQIRQAMEDENISKTAMAKRMKTSRRQLDRLLDPKGENITLSTMSKAAKAVGRELRIELV